MPKNECKTASPDFHECVKSFLLDCRLRNLTQTTINYYKFNLQAFADFLNRAGLQLADLTPSDLSERMMNDMIDNRLAVNTMRGRICTCQVFFKYIWKEGILPANIAANLKLLKSSNQAIFCFTEEQVHAILQQPNRETFTGLRDYVMMLILLETGMRVMELVNMKVSDIEFHEGTIRIPSGKGRKPRIVPIQKTCLYHLDRYIRERGSQPFDDFWITLNNKPFRYDGVKHMIIDRCKAAHIQGTRGSAHTFRHTMAKYYLLNGGDVFTLQHILGHTSIEMTQRYVDLFSRDIHNQHEKASPIEFIVAAASSEESGGVCI
ncbi:tyrosine-type recombinase/integrase [Paenibacillus athensensis]|uniref:Integrase n=1 Tax=Paenibacillus athensensis TaxID=1967502 RepID=A0A4Y8PZK3_9BACL|nr:tyrosine-type recombinase/integrase [Paenibacillus athensensis]MCD1261256.1 tyrosine-type recombinase/integrase [Paenibacillus athensensis]